MWICWLSRTCRDVVHAAVPGHRQPHRRLPAAVNRLVRGVRLPAAVPDQVLGLETTQRRTDLDQVERHGGAAEHGAQLTEHLWGRSDTSLYGGTR